jgi:short subunit dehydrogenase-like uncharacterized protein
MLRGRGMITLFGATGYTGRLVARALERADLEFRLAGRSPDRLAQLADGLSSSPARIVADVSRPETLGSLMHSSTVLVNCVGPFTDLGEPIVAQASLQGVNYLDITNELGFVRRMQSYDQTARQTGAAVVPTCGFEVALADCAAAILAQDAGNVDELRVVYSLSGEGSSYGSRFSAVRSLATSWIGYRKGVWVRDVPGRRVRRTHIGDRARMVLSFPSSEIATVPSHIQVSRVTTWTTISRGAFLWAPLVIPTFSWLARGPVGWLILRLISQVSPPPETGMRSDAPFLVRVEALGKDRSSVMTLTGTGVYDLTAEIAAYAAEELARLDYGQRGVLAPAVALNPQALLNKATSEWGVSVEIG